MYDLPHDLLDALKATPEILNGLLDGIGEAQARSARGGDENWSVVEVVCHLRDAEEFFMKRFQAMKGMMKKFSGRKDVAMKDMITQFQRR